MDYYILLKSGNLFYFAPHLIEGNIYTVDDIASGLAGEPRYASQNRDEDVHYSVAEHSCHIHDAMPIDDIDHRKQALIHDAPEAFFRDLPGPLKQYLPDYKRLIGICEVDMYRRFGLQEEMYGRVRHADEWMLREESEQLLHPSASVHFSHWPDPPMPVKMLCWGKARARAEYLERFHNLFGDLDTILPV